MDIKSYEKLVDHILTFCSDNNIGVEAVSDFIKKCCLDVLDRMVESDSYFIVMKKDCRIERFDTTKLYNSIANASDEIGQPLNSSDIKGILTVVRKHLDLSKKRVVSSQAIRQVVLNTLKDFGHNRVYENFKNYSM